MRLNKTAMVVQEFAKTELDSKEEVFMIGDEMYTIKLEKVKSKFVFESLRNKANNISATSAGMPCTTCGGSGTI